MRAALKFLAPQRQRHPSCLPLMLLLGHCHLLNTQYAEALGEYFHAYRWAEWVLGEWMGQVSMWRLGLVRCFGMRLLCCATLCPATLSLRSTHPRMLPMSTLLPRCAVLLDVAAPPRLRIPAGLPPPNRWCCSASRLPW